MKLVHILHRESLLAPEIVTAAIKSHRTEIATRAEGNAITGMH